MNPVVECVPNFSEGRNPATIGRLRQAASATLRHHTSDSDHNRTVLTLTGTPEAVQRDVLATVAVALETIDLARHQGVHPRIGAVDVIPFVPLNGIGLAECAGLATETAHLIWTRFHIPSYLYEAAARTPDRQRLETIRNPAFTGAPDIGTGRHPTAGATVIGARHLLVAWNIWLNSTNLPLAKTIARAIRASNGGLRGVKALGLPLASQNTVQVSINSTDLSVPLQTVYDEVEKLAHRNAVTVTGSELIGLIPQFALDASPRLNWLNLTANSAL